MTKTRLKRLCRDHQLYLTPAMNDVLYLHYQGFNKVENLDEYTDLKCLWLHNNHLHDLTSGLAHLVKLKALYLHHNRIVVMRGLETLTSLVTLNLCHNFITKLELIGSLPHLQTLEVSHNKLSTTDSISILPSCRSLSCLDLSHNHLSDPTVVHVLAGVVQLHVLQLQGNPCVGKVPHYRYSVTAKCQSLTYLDDRPVFPVDRAAAEAWVSGGEAAAREVRDRWRQKELRRVAECVNDVIRLRERVQREKAEKEAKKKAEKEANREANKEAERKMEKEVENKVEKETKKKAEKEVKKEPEKEAEKEAEKEVEKKAKGEVMIKGEKEAEKEAMKEIDSELEKEAENESEKEVEKEIKKEIERIVESGRETEVEEKAEAEAELNVRENLERDSIITAASSSGGIKSLTKTQLKTDHLASGKSSNMKFSNNRIGQASELIGQTVHADEPNDAPIANELPCLKKKDDKSEIGNLNVTEISQQIANDVSVNCSGEVEVFKLAGISATLECQHMTGHREEMDKGLCPENEQIHEHCDSYSSDGREKNITLAVGNLETKDQLNLLADHNNLRREENNGDESQKDNDVLKINGNNEKQGEMFGGPTVNSTETNALENFKEENGIESKKSDVTYNEAFINFLKSISSKNSVLLERAIDNVKQRTVEEPIISIYDTPIPNLEDNSFSDSDQSAFEWEDPQTCSNLSHKDFEDKGPDEFVVVDSVQNAHAEKSSNKISSIKILPNTETETSKNFGTITHDSALSNLVSSDTKLGPEVTESGEVTAKKIEETAENHSIAKDFQSGNTMDLTTTMQHRKQNTNSNDNPDFSEQGDGPLEVEGRVAATQGRMNQTNCDNKNIAEPTLAEGAWKNSENVLYTKQLDEISENKVDHVKAMAQNECKSLDENQMVEKNETSPFNEEIEFNEHINSAHLVFASSNQNRFWNKNHDFMKAHDRVDSDDDSDDYSEESKEIFPNLESRSSPGPERQCSKETDSKFLKPTQENIVKEIKSIIENVDNEAGSFGSFGKTYEIDKSENPTWMSKADELYLISELLGVKNNSGCQDNERTLNHEHTETETHLFQSSEGKGKAFYDQNAEFSKEFIHKVSQYSPEKETLNPSQNLCEFSAAQPLEIRIHDDSDDRIETLKLPTDTVEQRN